jgi:hypothetical protein
MGFRDLFSSPKGKDKAPASHTRGSSKELTMSKHNDHAQVVGFDNSAGDGSRAADVSRDLFAFPKPEKKETMADYINNHKEGDVFPYLAITGSEEEPKEGRIARLRAYTSPYNKSVKPEMRINGVILDMLVGSLRIEELKDHIDNSRLSSVQKRENRRFKDLNEARFSKPYVQIKRITGEFVPLNSSTSDYTDLMFSLQDDRLLENTVIVQSNKLPTNNIGIFELGCDYCIPTKDMKELSLKYELARPIMKDGYQWGSVSLTISMCESDTPYLTPKVEAMAIVKAPYTSVEEQTNDLDHKDVTYTSGQIEKFREMYRRNEIADNDDPRKEKLKASSYAKSSMRGGQKSVAAAEHLGGLDGWSHLKGSRKPLLRDGEASISARSDDDSEVVTDQQGLKEWEKEQKKARDEFNQRKIEESVARKDLKPAIKKHKEVESYPERRSIEEPPRDMEFDPLSSETRYDTSEEDEPEIIKKLRKKSVGFNVQDV